MQVIPHPLKSSLKRNSLDCFLIFFRPLPDGYGNEIHELVNWIYDCTLLVFLSLFSQNRVIYSHELLQENTRIQTEIKQWDFCQVMKWAICIIELYVIILRRCICLLRINAHWCKVATSFWEAQVWLQESQRIGKKGGWRWVGFVVVLSGSGIEISYL